MRRIACLFNEFRAESWSNPARSQQGAVFERAVKRQGDYGAQVLAKVALTGVLGMAIGMTLLLFALRGGEVGIVSTLSSTSPVIQLPLLWWLTKECPAITAWVGAGLVIVGTALIFTA